MEKTKNDYKNRINQVFEYIDENLNAELSLKIVSEIAFFSPFHFHRVFKFITGETLNEYIIRRKIEKSVLDLLHRNYTITEIAYKFGFNDSASFSKTFKKYYKVSPTEFKKKNPHKFSKIGQNKLDTERYICIINNLKSWINMNAQIEIKVLPTMELAYISSIGVKNIENAYGKLIQWATLQGLMNDKTKMITIYHDSLKITEPEKVRISTSILLYKPIKTEGEIGLRKIKSGKFIVGSFEIELNEFEKSWTGLFVWMNENGYKKSDQETFEIYNNNFNEHPERKAIVDFYIPIE